MARKRRSVHDPYVSYAHYVIAQMKNATAYNNMSETMKDRFKSGTQMLASLQYRAKEILNKLYIDGIPIVGMIRTELLKIPNAWLKASNEHLDDFPLAMRVAQITTDVVTTLVKSTGFTCDSFEPVVNGLMQKLGAYDDKDNAIKIDTIDGICVATPIKAMKPATVSSSNQGYNATLQQVLKYKTPQDLLESMDNST